MATYDFKFDIGDKVNSTASGTATIVGRSASNRNGIITYKYMVCWDATGLTMSEDATVVDKYWAKVTQSVTFGSHGTITINGTNVPNVQLPPGITYTRIPKAINSVPISFCNHNWVTYDSGWTKYEYCSVCDQRKKDENVNF